MIFRQRPRAVVFDMDGILFNTEDLYLEALVRAAGDLGVEAPVELYTGSIGTSSEATRARLTEHFGGEFDMDGLWNGAARHFSHLADTQLCLKPGVIELLDVLDGMRMPAAIATSSKPEMVNHHLGAHGLERRFRAVAAKGSYKRSKPHPDPFLTAAGFLGADPAFCVALEDSHTGVRSASSAGMMTIMVPDLLEANDEMRGLCAHVAIDLHEVARLIEAAQTG
jgi:HAD superfamily hydrolase (TIGR01509 family)